MELKTKLYKKKTTEQPFKMGYMNAWSRAREILMHSTKINVNFMALLLLLLSFRRRRRQNLYTHLNFVSPDFFHPLVHSFAFNQPSEVF